MEEEVKINWKYIVDEKHFKKNPEILNFIYDNAIKLINSIKTVSDKHNSKATVLLTSCILIIVAMIPIIKGIIPAVPKDIYLNSMISTIILSVPLLLYLILFVLVFVYIFRAALKFNNILGIESEVFPYPTPSAFFDNELYKNNSIKIKIGIIRLLEDIIHENYEKTVQKDKLFLQGKKMFQKGIVLLCCAFILFLIMHIVITPLLKYMLLLGVL